MSLEPSPHRHSPAGPSRPPAPPPTPQPVDERQGRWRRLSAVSPQCLLATGNHSETGRPGQHAARVHPAPDRCPPTRQAAGAALPPSSRQHRWEGLRSFPSHLMLQRRSHSRVKNPPVSSPTPAQVEGPSAEKRAITSPGRESLVRGGGGMGAWEEITGLGADGKGAPQGSAQRLGPRGFPRTGSGSKSSVQADGQQAKEAYTCL